MATLLKPTRPYPLPANAEIVERDGKPHVRLKDRGKTAFYPLTKDRTKYLKPSEKWYAKYRDASGAITLTPLSPNKDAAQIMLTSLLKRTEDEKVGIRSDFTDQRARPLAKLVEEYEQHATDRNITAKQAAQTRRRCEKVFEGCRFVTLANLDAPTVEKWLADRRRRAKQDGGISVQTSNHYVTALKAFGAWLVRTTKTPENPFRFMVKGNVEVDVRHVRRTLSADEFARLIAATRAGGLYRGLAGHDRAVLYLVAGMTGLRASELASLTPGSFSLDTDPPTVTVEAAYSKHRRRDEVPLHSELVAELGPWLEPKPKDKPLWGGKWAKQYSAAAMIRRDLDAARTAWIGEANSVKEKEQREQSDFLRYRDQDGKVVDFHALRHTFVTNLVNAGVMPKDAKELARHSTITLTMDRYAHVGIRDTAAAVAKLTVPTTRSTQESAALKATGTEGNGSSDVPPDVPTTGDGRLRLRTGENIGGAQEANSETLEPLQMQGFEGNRGRLMSGEGGIRSYPRYTGVTSHPPRHHVKWPGNPGF